MFHLAFFPPKPKFDFLVFYLGCFPPKFVSLSKPSLFFSHSLHPHWPSSPATTTDCHHLPSTLTPSSFSPSYSFHISLSLKSPLSTEFTPPQKKEKLSLSTEIHTFNFPGKLKNLPPPPLTPLIKKKTNKLKNHFDGKCMEKRQTHKVLPIENHFKPIFENLQRIYGGIYFNWVGDLVTVFNAALRPKWEHYIP